MRERGIIKWSEVITSQYLDVAISTVKTESGNVKMAIAVLKTAKEVLFSANNNDILL